MINKPMDPNFSNIDLLILNRSNTGYMLESKSVVLACLFCSNVCCTN